MDAGAVRDRSGDARMLVARDAASVVVEELSSELEERRRAV